MKRRRKDEPALCPDCPFLWAVPEIVVDLMKKQVTRIKEPPSNLRICMEMRRRYGPCQYYPRTENLLLYVTS